jgi:ABC-type multidrug transport system fused ATPase/permease subunit
MFSISVKGNIQFGKSEVIQEEVVEAAKIANAHDFLRKLSNCNKNGFNI